MPYFTAYPVLSFVFVTFKQLISVFYGVYT